jgi:PAS domain S-box-containing protein
MRQEAVAFRGLTSWIRSRAEGVPAWALLRGTLVRFVPVALLGICAAVLIQGRHREEALDHLRREGQRVVQAQEELMRQAFVGVALDLGRLLQNRDVLRYAAADGAAIRDAVGQELLNLARWRDSYDLLQVLDAEGREVVTVTRATGAAAPAIVSSASLGDVSVDTAFREATSLAPGGLFVELAALDGSSAAADVTPVLRFSAPIHDPSGALRGVLSLRWRADRLLEALRQAVPETRARVALVNENGRWLVGEEGEDGWRFRRPHQSEQRFDQSHPELWDSMQSRRSDASEVAGGMWIQGSMVYPRRGTTSRFNFGSRLPGLELDDHLQVWRIGYFVPETVLREHAGSFVLLPFRGVALTLLGLLAAGSAHQELRRRIVLRNLAESERRTAEQLAFSEALVDGLGVPLFVKDLRGRIVRCNAAFARLTGRDHNSCIGMDAAGFDPTENAERHAEVDAQVITNRRPASYDSEVFDGLGTTRAVIVTKAPLLGADGEVTGVVGALQDVSERQRAEAELRRALEFLERVLDALPTPVFVKDRDRRFVVVNDAQCAMTGIERARLLGSRDEDFFAPEEAAVYRQRDEHVFATGEVDLNEEALTAAGGTTRTIVTRKAMFHNQRGEEVLVGVISDITERKRAEEQLRLAARFFEHSNEGIVVCDAEERIVRVNPAFTEITGYTADEVAGRHRSFLCATPLDPDEIAEINGALADAGTWQGSSCTGGRPEPRSRAGSRSP